MKKLSSLLTTLIAVPCIFFGASAAPQMYEKQVGNNIERTFVNNNDTLRAYIPIKRLDKTMITIPSGYQDGLISEAAKHGIVLEKNIQLSLTIGGKDTTYDFVSWIYSDGFDNDTSTAKLFNKYIIFVCDTVSKKSLEDSVITKFNGGYHRVLTTMNAPQDTASDHVVYLLLNGTEWQPPVGINYSAIPREAIKKYLQGNNTYIVMPNGRILPNFSRCAPGIYLNVNKADVTKRIKY